MTRAEHVPGTPTVERIMVGTGPVWMAKPYVVSFFEVDIRDADKPGGHISREEFAARLDALLLARREAMLEQFDSHTREAA